MRINNYRKICITAKDFDSSCMIIYNKEIQRISKREVIIIQKEIKGHKEEAT